MRELSLRVPRVAVETVLDRLLPIVPGGVRELDHGTTVELVMRGAELPAREEIARAAGLRLDDLEERQVSDDWRERRVRDHVSDLIAGRLVVRPEWAPPDDRASLEIIVGDSAAFGMGGHPTTRTCLELLLELAPRGSFADLGCGTGVLAVAAAKLGWAPILAVDIQPASVQAAAANAARNQVVIDARLCDLTVDAPPRATGIAANVPAHIHRVIATGLSASVPELALLSGFSQGEAAEVVGAYEQRGLRERRRLDRDGWTVAVLMRE